MKMLRIKLLFTLMVLINCFGCLAAESEGQTCLQADPIEPVVQQPILPPIKVGQKTYYVETFFLANWYRANQFCRYQGMELASINNQEENENLLGEIQATYETDLHFWTSGNDLAVNGTFFWLSTGADFQFEDWDIGEPNHLRGEEHCVEVWARNGTFLWNDKICSFEAYIICEK